jgi:hypothetical protein
MSPETRTSTKVAQSMPPARTLRAFDIAHAPEYRRLWRARTELSAGQVLPQDVPGLGRGVALPMGFWLTDSVAEAGSRQPSFTVVFEPANAVATLSPAAGALDGSSPVRRPEQTVRLRPPNPLESEVVLRIGPGGARIAASETAWKAVAEPVLLAVGQYWRFALIEREIERLTELAHADHGHATMPTRRSLGHRSRLSASAQEVRALLIDLPHFEGPLTDHYSYCTTEQAALTYQALAEKLRLDEWCELIDEKAEAIEDTYEAVSEKLFEYKNFACEAVLESVIILILFAELALMLYESFGPG